MSRTLQRDCASQLVFSYLLNKEELENNFFNSFAENFPEFSDEDKTYALNVFASLKSNFDKIETKLASNLKSPLKPKDVYALDRAIIYTAICQIDFLGEDAPLVINEAVRFAKKYSTDKSPAFINGVLSSIYKQKEE